jgi:hypothetical protein
MALPAVTLENQERTMTEEAEDNARIAALTSDAVRHSGEKVVQDIMATVEAAEETTALLRQEAEVLAAEIRKHTEAFATRVSNYVENCHRAVSVFQTYQSQIFDLDTKPMDSTVVAEIAATPIAIEPPPAIEVPVSAPRTRIAAKVLPGLNGAEIENRVEG